jgi:hypothetical protein
LLKRFFSFIFEIDDVIVKNIKRIVAENRDIKVWNISLGSNQEVNDNFISAEAAALDQIQFENKSPSGFTILAFSLNIKPHIAPIITLPNNINVPL